MRDVTTEVNFVREAGNGMNSSMEVSAKMKSEVYLAAEILCAKEVETEVKSTAKSFKMEVATKMKISKECSN